MTPRDGDSWLADVRQAMTADALVEPPDWVRERARRLYPTRQRTETLLDRVRAVLLFDSRRGPALAGAGLRAVGAFDAVLDGPWQLLYRGGDLDIDLLVRPNQDGRTLNVRGQALSLAGGPVGVGFVEAQPAAELRQVHAVPPPPVWTEVDATGEFALPNLERGRYDVLLHLGTREIELSDVEL